MFQGVYSVLVTPFTDSGALDLDSLPGLVNHCIASGAAGVVCLGLASEVYKLADAERDAVVRTVIDAVSGRAQVIVGCEHSGVEPAVQRASSAAKAGADALMLFPPSFVRPDAAGIIDYYRRVAEASNRPIVVQDAPAWTNIQLPVPLLVELAAEVPAAGNVKVEAPPTAPKVAALQAEGVRCIGGLGGLYLAEELDRGLTATMPGCAYPGAHVEIMGLYGAGHHDEARQLYEALLPLTVFSLASLDLFVALQKQLLWRRGVIASPRLRGPATLPDEEQLAWGLALAERGPAARFLP